MKPPYRELRSYQDEAVDFILGRPHSGLFIDMGLGKTAIILHALLELPRPVLLVGPIRVIETVWRKEASLWLATRGLRFSLLRGSPKERRQAAREEADIYMVNPELLGEALEARGYSVLVVDESTLFKNPSSARFKILRKHLTKFKHRIIATGTPTPNSLQDLWAQVFLLDRGERLDRAFGRFQSTYFYPEDYMGYKFKAHDWASEVIVKKISDIVFRVSAEEALPARETLHNIIHCYLPEKALRHYKEVEYKAFTRIREEGETVTAISAAAAMMKLRQIASGWVYDDDGDPQQIHSEKVQAVRSVLEETGSPVIVVYQFRHELEGLKKAFPWAVEFDSDKEEAWNQGEIPLLLLHPQSGGHGINLQYGGHTMVIYSASFSLEQMSQTMGRIDRQGQEKPVIFHHLVAPFTVDELLLEVLERKSSDQTTILKMIKEYATR